MQHINVTIITAGLSVPSSSRMLTDAIAREMEQQCMNHGHDVHINTFELRDYAVDIANNMVTGFAPPKLEEALNEMLAVDIVVAITPVFTAGMSGLFKSFFDIIDNNALIEKPIIIGATGGSIRHSLVLDYSLRPMFSYLRANVMPTGIYATPDDWGSKNSVLDMRIRSAVQEAMQTIQHSSGDTTHTNKPAIRPSQENRSFEDMLADLTQSR